jgi:penicillin-insensitive murein DD-endopeptidase
VRYDLLMPSLRLPALDPRFRHDSPIVVLACAALTSVGLPLACADDPPPLPAAPHPETARAAPTQAPEGTTAAREAKRASRIKSMRAFAFGGGQCGALKGGTTLACDGSNFESFSTLACLLGRNHLHPLVTDTVRDAYAALQTTHPKRRWQYGDFGWASGGRLRPHKTHQNGLSADFFVPVSETVEGNSVTISVPSKVPIEFSNKLGYGFEFDATGRADDLEIAWHAITDHLLALEDAGEQHRTKIRRVILAPKLRKLLIQRDPRARRFATRFSKRPSWVRHDEHYHVDFEIPGSLKRPLSCD